MTKEIFIKYMTQLVELKEKEEILNKAFNAMCPEFNQICFSPYENIIVELLKEAMDDHFDYISWWLYENECGTKFKKGVTDMNGKKIPSETIEDLYNLINNYNEEEE